MRVDRLKKYFEQNDWEAFHKGICESLIKKQKFMFEHEIKNRNYLEEINENITECFDRVKNFGKDLKSGLVYAYVLTAHDASCPAAAPIARSASAASTRDMCQRFGRSFERRTTTTTYLLHHIVANHTCSWAGGLSRSPLWGPPWSLLAGVLALALCKFH